LGPGRARWAYAFRTLIEKGHLLAGSSDAPFDAFDPWIGIRCAVRRTDAAGRSANPLSSEALSPEMAISLYTANGGRALGEPSIGELRAGARADLLVLNGPTLAAVVEAVREPVAETWSGGVRVA
jgi:predicted amidohydrolase YtcJ